MNLLAFAFALFCTVTDDQLDEATIRSAARQRWKIEQANRVETVNEKYRHLKEISSWQIDPEHAGELGRNVYRNKNEKQSAIVQATIDMMQAKADCLSRSVGAFGQTIDIAEYKQGNIVVSKFGFEVFQIIDDKTFIVKQPAHDKLLWVQGIPTTNLTSGALVTIPDPVYVIGTKTYGTQVGTNTIHAVRALTDDELEIFVDEYKLAMKAKPAPHRFAFKDKSREFDGILLEFDGKLATIEVDGKVERIKIAYLVPADLKYCRQKLGDLEPIFD